MQGFTLIEIIMVIAIVGIVASFALPSYKQKIGAVHRSDAENTLTLFRQAMERHYSKKYSYLDAAESGDLGVPRIFYQQSPVQGRNKYYTLEISRAGIDCFELKATPIEDSSQAVDRCGILYLNHAGQRGSENDTGLCWNGLEAYQPMSDDSCG